MGAEEQSGRDGDYQQSSQGPQLLQPGTQRPPEEQQCACDRVGIPAIRQREVEQDTSQHCSSEERQHCSPFGSVRRMSCYGTNGET